jgi:hypothetical protein
VYEYLWTDLTTLSLYHTSQRPTIKPFANNKEKRMQKEAEDYHAGI